MNKKNFAIIIEARTNSSRLPYKVIKKINGMSVLESLINRIKHQNQIKKIIVATTRLKRDDEIESICKKKNIVCFRGHESDLIKRVSDAAIKNNVTDIIQLTSDNPLVDIQILLNLYKIYLKGKYDFVSNSIKRTFPIGTDIRIFSLKKLVQYSKKVHGKKREHTCYYFLKNDSKIKRFNLIAKKKHNRPDLRLTLDYPEDFELIKRIIIYFNKKYKYFDLSKIINFIDKNPKFKKLNSKHAKHYEL